jgi:hypothetical protein
MTHTTKPTPSQFDVLMAMYMKTVEVFFILLFDVRTWR